MELRQLEYVLAVAREGSFTRAAETLFLSQSSLSKQIHKLEVELGCPLFTRGRGDVALTEAGEQVVRAAPGILGTWNTLCASLARRELTLAVTPAFSHYALAGRVADFSRDHPEIRLQMAEYENAEVPRLLTTGRAELAIFRLEGDRTLRTHVLCTDELALLLPRDHPCTKESAVSLTRFHRERVLLLGGGTHLQSLIFQCFARAGAEPVVCFEGSNADTIRELVAQGAGAAILLGQVARSLARQDSRLAAVPFLETRPVEFGLAACRNAILTPQARMLWQFLVSGV